MKILAICAHADDVEIYCLGLLHVWRAAGADVAWAIACDSHIPGDSLIDRSSWTRRNEACAAAGLFGVTPHFLGCDDGALVHDKQLYAKLRLAIDREAPDLIVTHAADDYHADHRALSRAVDDAALRVAPVLHADTYLGVGTTAPSITVDISSAFDHKVEALMCHTSQNPSRFVKDLEIWNAFRARQAGAAHGCYAEAYHFSPVFPFADVRALLPPAPSFEQNARPDLDG